MKVNGIIAEYNPFHKGHEYHIAQSKALTGADYTVVVMSGNFVQRGAPALLDKHTRTRMALLSGADLVLELPALYATASAEFFADGGVSLLTGLGAVTHLCFGSECGDIVPLQKLASILAEEPGDYRDSLKEYLRRGMTYPEARTRALLSLAPAHALDPVACKELLSSPNNILGLEYCKAVLRRKSSLIPVTIPRVGCGYHDTVLSDRRPIPDNASTFGSSSASGNASFSGDTNFCSATAIRHTLVSGGDISLLESQMPEPAYQLLAESLQKNLPLHSDDFSSALYYKLLSESPYGYEKYLDVSSDISERIRNHLNEYRSFTDFCNRLKTKEITYTRISRCLLHILLNLTKSHMDAHKSLPVPYARVLGLRKSAAPLMHAVKEASQIPLVTKLADAEAFLSPEAYPLLIQDIEISRLYYGIGTIVHQTDTTNEYSIPLVVI